MNCPNGHTATGTKPTVGRTVACERALIGKWLVIHGIGKRRCEDRGGAITEDKIDLYVADIPTAYAFGRKQLTYEVIE